MPGDLVSQFYRQFFERAKLGLRVHPIAAVQRQERHFPHPPDGKSPRRVSLVAYTTAKDALPNYAHRFSPKMSSQHQLFACLMLKGFFKTDYRGIVNILLNQKVFYRAHLNSFQNQPERRCPSPPTSYNLDRDFGGEYPAITRMHCRTRMNTESTTSPTPQIATFQGSRVLVIGLGRFGGGVAVSRWLAAQGAHLTITDLADPDTLSESLAQIATLDADLRLGTHDGIDPGNFDLAIINPAVVKRRSELFSRINQAGTPWTTEMNLFCQRCPSKLIGITGSFGKSTTCAMLTTILEAAAIAKVIPHPNIHLGGNIGRSLLGDLEKILPEDLVVLEMSNAQLEDLPRINRTPDLAAITNMTPHHLDRYDAEDEYFNAKFNIARTQETLTPIFFGDLHPRAEKLLAELLADQPQRLHRIAPPSEPFQLAVPGDHNQINAAAALTISAHLGIDENFARNALLVFRGLPDRLEHVRTIDGATYINDSKSTAPQATTIAIQAIRQTPEYAKSDLIVIVGGKKKDVDFAECGRILRNECRLVICTGESGEDFSDAIHELANETDHQPTRVEYASTVPDAVTIAKKSVRKNNVVLFSPGAPSFDAYVNYVARGEHFRNIVNAT